MLNTRGGVMLKKKSILGMFLLIFICFTGCSEKSSGSETNNFYQPKECESIVSIPNDGILSYINSNVKNSIKGNLKNIDYYSINLNGDGFLLSGSALSNSKNIKLKTNDFGYILDKDNSFYCDSTFFPKDFITVLAYKEDHIVSASFILVEQTDDAIKGKVIKSYGFDKIDDEYQTVSKESLETLREKVFKDYYYINSTDMKEIIDSIPESSDVSSTNISFDGKDISSVKVNNPLIKKTQIDRLSPISFISNKADGMNFNNAKYYLYFISRLPQDNKFGIQFLSKDGIVSYLFFSTTFENGELSYSGGYVQDFKENNGLNNNYFLQLLNK